MADEAVMVIVYKDERRTVLTALPMRDDLLVKGPAKLTLTSEDVLTASRVYAVCSWVVKAMADGVCVCLPYVSSTGWLGYSFVIDQANYERLVDMLNHTPR